MAVRTQIYQGLLWQQIIAEKGLKAGARLPPLFATRALQRQAALEGRH